MGGAFDILNTMFVRVLILFVGFRLLSPYPIIAKNLAHTPHKLFMCIVRKDVDWGATIAKEVLKDL